MIPNSQIQTHWDSSNRNLCRIRTADWEMKPLIITKNSLLLHKMVSFVDSDALFLLSVPRWIIMLPTTGESSCSCLCSLKCIPVNYYYLPEKKEKKRSVDGDRWSRHIAEKLKKQSTATHIYSFTGVGSLLIHHYCWFTSCLDCHSNLAINNDCSIFESKFYYNLHKCISNYSLTQHTHSISNIKKFKREMMDGWCACVDFHTPTLSRCLLYPPHINGAVCMHAHTSCAKLVSNQHNSHNEINNIDNTNSSNTNTMIETK